MARSVIDTHSIVYFSAEDMQTSTYRRIRTRLERKIAKEPVARDYIELAVVEARIKNWEQAQEAIQLALELEPTDQDALLFSAQLYESMNEEKKASERYQSVLKTYPDFSKAYREYGRFFMRSSFSSAQTYLLKALELNPKDALAHVLLAEIFVQRERINQALLHLELAKRFQEMEPLFHQRSAQLFLQLEKFEEAAKQLKLALKIDPKNKLIRQQARMVQKMMKEPNIREKTQFWKRWNAK